MNQIPRILFLKKTSGEKGSIDNLVPLYTEYVSLESYALSSLRLNTGLLQYVFVSRYKHRWCQVGDPPTTPPVDDSIYCRP